MYPVKLGFKMPPEWGRHSRTLMAWPIREALWPEPFSAILPSYANIVDTIARFEPVTLLVKPELQAEAASFCGPHVTFFPVEHDDSWIRDNGPTFLRNDMTGKLAGVNWTFNAWGNKFPHERDNRVAPQLLQHFQISRFDAPFVMEGGSIHTDGEGTVLTTEECLLKPNRNPGTTREQLESYLRNYLGARKFIWLKRGWDGDDTDGHVDNIACFARPGVIMTQVCSDPADPNYAISQENLEILNTATDARGQRLRIISVEQPPAHHYAGMRLTLSYINFYFVNGGIVMPVFGKHASQTDAQAVSVMKTSFPDREIATVDGLIVARGGGNVHCLTQQIPVA